MILLFALGHRVYRQARTARRKTITKVGGGRRGETRIRGGGGVSFRFMPGNCGTPFNFTAALPGNCSS